MKKVLYIVVYQDDLEWLADGILYIGFDGDVAEKIYVKTDNTDLHCFNVLDNSIIEVDEK